jgi:hypothetical protein
VQNALLRTCKASWRSGYAAVCKTAYAGSIPADASTLFLKRDSLERSLDFKHR